MSPEVARLTYRAVIDYLGGKAKEFEENSSKAMIKNGDICCPVCNKPMSPCKVKNRIFETDTHVCTSCGYVPGYRIVDHKLIKLEESIC